MPVGRLAGTDLTMKALVSGEAFVNPSAAHAHDSSISTHDNHSTDFGHQIPAAAVAAITFGHVMTALLIFGLQLYSQATRT